MRGEDGVKELIPHRLLYLLHVFLWMAVRDQAVGRAIYECSVEDTVNVAFSDLSLQEHRLRKDVMVIRGAFTHDRTSDHGSCVKVKGGLAQ